jgi:hypothetical protein
MSCGHRCSCLRFDAPASGQGLALRSSSPTAEPALRERFGGCEREPGVFVIPGDRVGELRSLIGGFSVVDRQSLRACVADAGGCYDPWSSQGIDQALERVETPWFAEVLRDRTLSFRYQPIVDAVTGEVYAHEALMRAYRGETPVSPEALVRSAKAHGALLNLDQACRREAIEQAAEHLRAGGRVFINFFPITVYDPEVCLATTFAAAERVGADIQQLTFEVVESEQFRVSVREDLIPVRGHVHHDPAAFAGLVERPIESPDVGVSVVGPLPFGVGVVHDHGEARPVARGGPLEHLQVAVGVAERENRASADVALDADGLAGLVVDEVDLRAVCGPPGHPAVISNWVLMLEPTTCSGGMP